MKQSENLATRPVEIDTVQGVKDQEIRVADTQIALIHAQTLLEAVHHDRISREELVAASYFAFLALDQVANDQAEKAALFALLHANKEGTIEKKGASTC